jgi:hypothetical protein
VALLQVVQALVVLLSTLRVWVLQPSAVQSLLLQISALQVCGSVLELVRALWLSLHLSVAVLLKLFANY